MSKTNPLDFGPRDISLDGDDVFNSPQAPPQQHAAKESPDADEGKVRLRGLFIEGLDQPGRFAELQKESRSLAMMDVFKGFQFEYMRGVTPNLQATHSLSYPEGDQEPQTYNFGLTYVSPNQETVMTSRIDTDGVLQGRLIQSFGDNCSATLSAQTGPDPSRMSQLSADVTYKGPDYTTEFQYATSMHQWCASYLQRVARNWIVGIQGVYLHGRAASWLSGGVRYEDDNNAVSVVLEGLQGAVGSYTRKISDQVKVTSELRLQQSNPQNVIDSQAMVGWEYRLRMHSVTSTFDTAGTVRTVLEDRASMGFMFVLASEINFPQRYYKFGMRMALQL